jgi:hypothetical protein
MIGVMSVEDRTPLILLGLFAFGEESDLGRLDAAARLAGLPSRSVPDEDGSRHQAIFFPPGVDRSSALAIFRQAREGAFGLLRLEVIIVPVAAALDGVDFETEVSAEPPSFIAEPIE